MVITIDGMSATGKSTLALKLAQELGLKYLNSGSIYRCVALKIMNQQIDPNNSEDLFNKVVNLNIDFLIEKEVQKVFLDGIDVTLRIKDEDVSVFTPKYAGLPIMKTAIRQIQKKFVDAGNLVIEGRDIGTIIAPNADYKFYLYANLDIRAKRVYNMLKNRENVSLEQIKNNLEQRDKKDIEDKSFIKPKEAIEIDTSNLEIDEVLKIMLKYVKK